MDKPAKAAVGVVGSNETDMKYLIYRNDFTVQLNVELRYVDQLES